MFNQLKTWWNESGSEIFSFAAIVTVCVTLVGSVGYVVVWAGNFMVDMLHLSWLIRGWMIGSFAYVAVQIFSEYQVYRLDPESYNLWSENEEKEPTETGVE